MRNRSGGKSVLLIFILILLIIGIGLGGAYVYFVTDLFKTPEQLFKKYLLSNVLQLAQVNVAPFNEIEERSETEVTEYTLNIGFDPQKIEGIEETEEAEKYDGKVILTTDIPNRNKNLEILVNKANKEFFNGKIALTDETFGVKVPDLYDNYLAVENRDFKKIAETFNLPEEIIAQIPDKLPSAMTEEEQELLNQLSTKFITKITEPFGENSYIAEKNLVITINGKEILSDRYTLAVSSQTIYNSFTTAISELLEDPDFATLCKDRITDEQLKTIKEGYKDLISEINVEEIEDKTIKISVYVADKKTVKTELSVDENKAYVTIGNNENESIITFVVNEPKSENNKVGAITTTTIKNIYTNNTGELSVETKIDYEENDVKALEEELERQTAEYNYQAYASYDIVYKDQTMKYIVKTTKINDDTITGKIDFENEGLDYIKPALSIDFKCQFGKAKVETITDSNATVINDFAMEDYQELSLEIVGNLTKLAIEKPDSLIPSIFISRSTPDFPSIEDEEANNNSYDDECIDNDIGNYEDITLPDDADNDNYLYPTTVDNTETIRNDVDVAITNGLNNALNSYKTELMFNPEANIGDFLTVDNVQQSCGDRYILELLDSTTIKCTVSEGGKEYIYYALMNIDGAELVVTEVEVLTENEYVNR